MSARTVVTITNHEELLDFFCTARVHGDTVEMMNQRLSHRVYKDTRCGAWAKLLEDGVQFGSIVEGSDAEATGDPLRYPFTSEEVVNALEWVESRVDEILSEGKP